MSLIADRTNDGALSETAVAQIAAAYETLRGGAKRPGRRCFRRNCRRHRRSATGSRASERRCRTAMRASSAGAGRRRWTQGPRRFLTLGGHQLSFVLTSLTYFRCSGSSLENAIDVKRSSRLVAVDVALRRPVEMRSAISALYFAPPSLLRAAAIGAENICFSVWRAVLPGHMSELLELCSGGEFRLYGRTEKAKRRGSDRGGRAPDQNGSRRPDRGRWL